MARPWNTGELRALMRKKYAAPQYALFEEVRNGTGFSRSVTRSADALAFSLWPSRGLELHGFELKVDRRDWQRELLEPAKAEELQRFCDRWWVVAPAEMVQPGELPPTWGLLNPNGRGGLTAAVEAPKLEAKPLDRLMLASLFRNLKDGEEDRFRARADDLVAERAKLADHTPVERELAQLKVNHERVMEAVRRFEKGSGLNVLSGWDGDRVGELLGLVGGKFSREGLAWVRDAAQQAEKIYTEAAEAAARLRDRIDRAVPEKKPEAA